MGTLEDVDRQLFLFLNGMHSPNQDWLFSSLSENWVWGFVLFPSLYLLYKEFGAKMYIPIIMLALSIVFADQMTSGFMKPFFARLRPTHEPELAGLIHIVNGYTGGLYGFASSHAANAFAGVTMIVLLLGRRYKYLPWLFLFATLVSYSRIYLGVHYVSDIIVGAAVGSLGSYLIVAATKRVLPSFGRRISQ